MTQIIFFMCIFTFQAALLISLLSSTFLLLNLILLSLAAYLHHSHEQREIAQGRLIEDSSSPLAHTDILWSSHKWSFYISSWGNLFMVNMLATWWTYSLREMEWDQACLLAEVFNTTLFTVQPSPHAQLRIWVFFDVTKANDNLCKNIMELQQLKSTSDEISIVLCKWCSGTMNNLLISRS